MGVHIRALYKDDQTYPQCGSSPPGCSVSGHCCPCCTWGTCCLASTLCWVATTLCWVASSICRVASCPCLIGRKNGKWWQLEKRKFLTIYHPLLVSLSIKV